MARKQKIPTKRIECNNISLGTKRKNWKKIEQQKPKVVHTNRAKELIHAYWKHEKRSPKDRTCDTCQNETHNLTKQELLVATSMCLSKTWDYHNHSLPTLAKKKALAQVESTIDVTLAFENKAWNFLEFNLGPNWLEPNLWCKNNFGSLVDLCVNFPCRLGHYEKRNALPFTSRYTAKFLEGHYELFLGIKVHGWMVSYLRLFLDG